MPARLKFKILLKGKCAISVYFGLCNLVIYDKIFLWPSV